MLNQVAKGDKIHYVECFDPVVVDVINVPAMAGGAILPAALPSQSLLTTILTILLCYQYNPVVSTR